MGYSRFFIVMASGLFFSFSGETVAKDLFNPALLEIDHPVDIDIRQFNRANALPAGIYQVDITVNGDAIGSRQVTFEQNSADDNLHACFVNVKSVLAELGVKVDAIKSLGHIDDNACLDPAPLVPGTTWALNADKLQLDITVPQIYVDAAARGAISPSRWDEGINALMVNYEFSGSSTVKSDDGENNDFYYLNLRNGANFWCLAFT